MTLIQSLTQVSFFAILFQPLLFIFTCCCIKTILLNQNKVTVRWTYINIQHTSLEIQHFITTDSRVSLHRHSGIITLIYCLAEGTLYLYPRLWTVKLYTGKNIREHVHWEKGGWVCGTASSSALRAVILSPFGFPHLEMGGADQEMLRGVCNILL